MAGCTSSYKLVESNGVRVEVEKVTNKSIEYLILEQDRVSVSLYKDPTQGSDTNNGNDLNQKITEINSKLKNKSFLKNAPKQIISRDKKALIDYEYELKKLNSILNSIKN